MEACAGLSQCRKGGVVNDRRLFGRYRVDVNATHELQSTSYGGVRGYPIMSDLEEYVCDSDMPVHA